MMKTFAPFAALFACAAAFAADATGFAINVTGIPANATEVVALVDTAAPPPAGYDDTPAVAIPQPAQPAANADPAAQAQRRRRAGGRGPAAPPPPPVRVAAPTNGATSLTLSAPTVAGDRYQIRVVAVKGDGRSPVVLAGGRIAQAKVDADQVARVDVALAPPKLKLSPDNPATVAPGASYTLTGTLTDAANCLGTKNRMRVWLSAAAPPRANFTGTQTSTIDVTTEGDDVTFSFTLTAPKEPGTLYFQFGELPSDFTRADGQQAPLLVLPDVSAGAAAFVLRIER